MNAKPNYAALAIVGVLFLLYLGWNWFTGPSEVVEAVSRPESVKPSRTLERARRESVDLKLVEISDRMLYGRACPEEQRKKLQPGKVLRLEIEPANATLRSYVERMYPGSTISFKGDNGDIWKQTVENGVVKTTVIHESGEEIYYEVLHTGPREATVCLSLIAARR